MQRRDRVVPWVETGPPRSVDIVRAAPCVSILQSERRPTYLPNRRHECRWRAPAQCVETGAPSRCVRLELRYSNIWSRSPSLLSRPLASRLTYTRQLFLPSLLLQSDPALSQSRGRNLQARNEA